MIGFILVDKPVGPSSHQAVQQVRRALGIGGRRGLRAGHAGTLDPFASGLLLVLVGRATRLVPHVVGHDKRYLVDVRFGAASDTDDATGTLTPDASPQPTRATVLRAIDALAGVREQVPPAVSALHIDGERAWRRVRRGEVVEVPARAVRFDRIRLVEWEEDDGASGARAVLDVRCSTGTYMRALARDLGAAVGCAAHCSALRRLEVGPWHVAGAPAPCEVSAEDVRDPLQLLELPRVSLDRAALVDVCHGRAVPLTAGPVPDGDVALVAPDGTLAAIAGIDGAFARPRVVFAELPAAATAGGVEGSGP